MCRLMCNFETALLIELDSDVCEPVEPAIQFIVDSLMHLNGALQNLSKHAFTMNNLHQCFGIEHLCPLEMASTVASGHNLNKASHGELQESVFCNSPPLRGRVYNPDYFREVRADIKVDCSRCVAPKTGLRRVVDL